MYINFIDKNGNEETVFNIYTEEFKKKAFSKQSKLNEIGILICESKIYKKENIIPEHLYSKAISIINGRDDKYYAKQCEGLLKMTEEQKEKYANFLYKVSEILGLNKPVDILRLCAVTDEYFKPIEKRIAELEKENEKLKKRCGNYEMEISKMEKGTCDICRETEKDEQLAKAIELISKLSQLKHRADDPFTCDEYTKLIKETEQFLKETE